jgi:type IV pilus assembly protein PilM
MAFGFSKTRFSPIAIDFGADSVKLLQIIPGSPPQLQAAAAAVIPEEARVDAAARQSFLAETLKTLLHQQPFKGRRAILSIPAFQTLVQHLEIPRGEQEEFEAQVAAQLRERLNVDPSRLVVRHFPVGQVVRDGSTLQQVVCFAASRDAVMRYLELARRCKLDVVGMESEPMAILQAFSHLYRRAEDQARVTCFVDIGAATTKVVIAQGAKIVFAKTIHAAGDHFTRQIASAQQMGFTEAREFRMTHAAQPQAGEATLASGGGTTTDTRSNAGTGLAVLDAQVDVQPTPRATAVPTTHAPAGHGDHRAPHGESADALDCLIDELQLCLRYYRSLFADRTIEKLVFLGGEARNVKTCHSIARAVRIAAQLGDPFARLSRLGLNHKVSGIDMEQPQPGWAVPMGLCLSEDQAT